MFQGENKAKEVNKQPLLPRGPGQKRRCNMAISIPRSPRCVSAGGGGQAAENWARRYGRCPRPVRCAQQNVRLQPHGCRFHLLQKIPTSHPVVAVLPQAPLRMGRHHDRGWGGRAECGPGCRPVLLLLVHRRRREIAFPRLESGESLRAIPSTTREHGRAHGLTSRRDGRCSLPASGENSVQTDSKPPLRCRQRRQSRAPAADSMQQRYHLLCNNHR